MCGITAFYGENFSPTIFSYLCIAQDVRGGDGGGLVFEHDGNLVIKKCQPLTRVFDNLRISRALGSELYSDELADLVPYIPNDTNLIIGHARKASAGDMRTDNIAPIHRGNVVMSHNGTLFNDKQLADVLGMNFEEWMSDSHVLAEILDQKKYDMLTDYNGTAALVWTRLDEDGLYLFCGKSYNKIERPLHIMDMGDSFYISSLKDPLDTAFRMLHKPDASIFHIRTNVIWKVHDGEIKQIMEVSRQNKTPAPSKPVRGFMAKNDDFIVRTPHTSAVYFYKGRYYDQQDNILSTEVNINNGKVEYIKNIRIMDKGFISSAGKIRYFFDGMMFKDKTSFEEFILLYSESYNYSDLIGLVAHPIWYGIKNNLVNSNFYINHEGFNRTLNEEYVFPFCEKLYTFEKGTAVEIQRIPFSVAQNRWKI